TLQSAYNLYYGSQPKAKLLTTFLYLRLRSIQSCRLHCNAILCAKLLALYKNLQTHHPKPPMMDSATQRGSSRTLGKTAPLIKTANLPLYFICSPNVLNFHQETQPPKLTNQHSN